MRDLTDRVAIVTGASSGIGVFLAEALAEHRVRVVLAARRAAPLQQLAVNLRQRGAHVLAVPTDVTKARDREQLISHALGEFGSIDVLINNAGIETYCPFEELSSTAIEQTIVTNLTASLQLARLTIPSMLAQGRGHIVNLASTAGMHGPAFGTAYGASKAGMISMSQSLRAEFRGRGVSASAVCPGFTHDGGMYETMKAATGRRTPAFMGSTTALQVTKAVLRAIQFDRPEVIVNWPPMRPVYTLSRLWPRLGSWLIEKCSYRFLKRIANRHSQSDRTAQKAA